MSAERRKTAIVLGGDRGYGADIAKDLGARQFNIALPFFGNSNAVNDVISDIEAHGGTAIALFADICQPLHLRAVYKTTIEAFGKVDAVIYAPLWPGPTSPRAAFLQAVEHTFSILTEVNDLLQDDGQFLGLFVPSTGAGEEAPFSSALFSDSVVQRLRCAHRTALLGYRYRRTSPT